MAAEFISGEQSRTLWSVLGIVALVECTGAMLTGNSALSSTPVAQFRRQEFIRSCSCATTACNGWRQNSWV